MESKRNLIPLLSKDLVELKRDVKSLKDSNLRTESKINELGQTFSELKQSSNKFEQSFNQLEQSFTEVKREILFFKEEILGEIKETREEFSIALNQYTRHEDVLDDHSKRLSKLEVKVFSRSSR